MLKSGNSNVLLCADNLIRTVRGEVPNERMKGIDSSIIDQPIQQARIAFEKDLTWLLENYEPRLDVETVEPAQIEALYGEFLMTVRGA